MGDPYVFYFRDPETGGSKKLKVEDYVYNDPKHPSHKAFQETLSMLTGKYGKPVKVDEGTVGGTDVRVSLPGPLGGVNLPIPEVKAGTARNLTSIAGQMLGGEAGIAGGAALGGMTGPLAPIAVPALATAGAFLGGAGGQKGAQMAQQGMGIAPDPTSPTAAGALNAAFAPLGFAGGALGRRGARGVLTDTQDIGALQGRAASFENLGITNPSIPQISGTKGLQTSIQQLAMDLPILRGGVGRWLDNSVKQVNDNLRQRGLKSVSRLEAGEAAAWSSNLGQQAWREQGGKMMEDFYSLLPQGKQTPVPIDDIIKVIGAQDTVTNEIIRKLARSGNDSAKYLDGFIERYGRGTIVIPGGGSRQVFAQAPVGEVHDIRKALSDIYKAVGPGEGGIADAEKKRLYGILSETIQGEAKRHPGALDQWQKANHFWSEQARLDETYMKAFTAAASPAKINTAIQGAISRGEADALKVIKDRVLGDEILGEEAWRKIQQSLISQVTFKGDAPDLTKFLAWYNKAKADPKVISTVFDAEHRKLLEDLAVVADSFWPVARKQGQTFVAQQIERPGKVAMDLFSPGRLTAGAIGAGAGGAALGAPGIGALLGAGFMLTPGITQKLITNKPFIKWLTHAARMDEKSIGAQLGLLGGSIVNTMNDSDAEAVMQYLSDLQKVMGQAESLNSQRGGIGPIQIAPGGGAGPLGG